MPVVNQVYEEAERGRVIDILKLLEAAVRGGDDVNPQDFVPKAYVPRKPKVNRKGEEGKVSKFDQCQTPPYAVEPLLPYLKQHIVWESACGEMLLANAIAAPGIPINATDLSMDLDFFKWQPNIWTAQVTNPPYSIKPQWLRRSYELDKPFALLVPVEFIGTQGCQKLIQAHGFEMMLLDARVDFKMPDKAWGGKGAQFPVLWLCHNILPEKVMFGSIKAGKQAFNDTLKAALAKNE